MSDDEIIRWKNPINMLKCSFVRAHYTPKKKIMLHARRSENYYSTKIMKFFTTTQWMIVDIIIVQYTTTVGCWSKLIEEIMI